MTGCRREEKHIIIIITVSHKSGRLTLVIWTYSHGFERLDDDPVDLVKQVVGDVPSSSALQIEPQVTDRPLPAVNVIVVVLRSNREHILANP